MNKVNLFWLRRDLRLQDNAGLHQALIQGLPVMLIFIFDKHILNELPISDRRVNFIHKRLETLQLKLVSLNSSLHVYYNTPELVFKGLATTLDIQNVYTNHDYEPYALERDLSIKKLLEEHNIKFVSMKDQVIFETNEIVKDDGMPYTVFTPYSKKWKLYLKDKHLEPFPSELYFSNFLKTIPQPIPSLNSMGFEELKLEFPTEIPNEAIIRHYHETRDIPSLAGTTRLSLHLRFGTISIRQLVKLALNTNEKYLNELIWREFYQSILWHFPKVVNSSFKPQYDSIKWRNNEIEFNAWCEGRTGYPIVDAGMRELNSTGWMHNRVRMIVASFLTKHLLIDWRWGEAYFAKHLNDFELASNNGGWQWAAGSGVDAAPYFRIFNPRLQTEKFDSQLQYIRKWVPEFEGFDYPQPIVRHEEARIRCLDVYKEALKTN